MALKRSLPLAAGVAALALVAAPAFAVLPYTVSVNNVTSGTSYDVTAVSKGPVTITLPSDSITCSSVLLAGAVNTGTVQNPTPPIADFASSTWSQCTHAGSTPGAAISQSSTWALNGDGDNSSTIGVDNHINGAVDAVSAQVTLDGPFGDCEFEISGSMDAYLDEATGGATSRQELVIPSADLFVSNVDSAFTCLGQVNVNDGVDLAGEFVLAFDTPFNIWE
jgi:hypothetical protein